MGIVNRSHSTVRENNCIVNGNHNKVFGNNCIVNGNHCKIYGNHCTNNGNHCTIFGTHCIDNGSHCKNMNGGGVSKTIKKKSDAKNKIVRSFSSRGGSTFTQVNTGGNIGAMGPFSVGIGNIVTSGPSDDDSSDDSGFMTNFIDGSSSISLTGNSSKVTIAVNNVSVSIVGAISMSQIGGGEAKFKDFSVDLKDGRIAGKSGTSIMLLDLVGKDGGTIRYDTITETLNAEKKRELDGEDSECEEITDISTTCVICWSNKRACAPKRCKHFAYCLTCARKLNECSICKTNTDDGFMKIIVS